MQKDKDIKRPQFSIEDTGMVKLRMGMGQPVSRFDPYQGVMSAKRPSRKKDLRKVQQWLEAKRRAEQIKRKTRPTDIARSAAVSCASGAPRYV